MFKNRIRTAAIAGIAALATGLSGITVANAQPLNDGSNQTEVQPTDQFELDLFRANDAVRDDIRDLQGDPIFRTLITDREAFLSGDFDQSEEALAANIADYRLDVQAALAQAVENIDTAREGILDAQEKDAAAREALAAYGEAAAALGNYFFDEVHVYTNPITGQQDLDEDGNPIEYNLFDYLSTFYGVELTTPEGLVDLDDERVIINGETIDVVDAEIYLLEFADNIQVFPGNDGQADALQTGDYTEILPSDVFNSEDVQGALASFEALFDAVAETDQNGNYVEGTILEQLETLLDEDAPIDVPNSFEPPAIVLDGYVSETQARLWEARQVALGEIQGDVEGLVADLNSAEEAWEDAAFEATKASVNARTEALRDATSQRNVLRGYDGYLAGAQRYLELYNDDVLTDSGTLRQQYYNLFNTFGNTLAEALEAVAGGENAGIDGNYVTTMDRFLNELVRLNLVEQSVADQAERDRLQEERDQAIIEGIGGNDDPDNGNGGNNGSGVDDPAVEGGSAVEIDGSSEGGFGTIGILAGIAAVIGLIAAAIPFLGNFLPNLPF